MEDVEHAMHVPVLRVVLRVFLEQLDLLVGLALEAGTVLAKLLIESTRLAAKPSPRQRTWNW